MGQRGLLRAWKKKSATTTHTHTHLDARVDAVGEVRVRRGDVGVPAVVPHVLVVDGEVPDAVVERAGDHGLLLVGGWVEVR